MKKILFAFIAIFLFTEAGFGQALVGSYPFTYYNPYNYFWGITQRNDTLWIMTDYNGTGYTYSMIYKVTKTGVVKDSLTTPFTFNHGLAWDGTGFWIAQDYKSGGAKIYKINSSGVLIDSITTGSYAGGIGGIALDGNALWFAVYHPDNTSYPFAYAYKMDLTSRQLVDTIPLRGKQVQGIAVKGDTIFYVNDNFQSDPERIYAYRKAVGDTLFSFAVPDPDGDCDPRGLYWDGSHLYLMAYRIGNNVQAYRTLYKYQISGQGSPQITTSVNTIDFGNIIIGQTSTQNLTVTNTGTAKLIITAKTITNSVFGINPNNVPDTINAGQLKNYTMSFTPSAFDSVSGQLQIASNDVGVPVKTITLKGKGVYSGSNIQLSATSYNYQQRRINSLCGYQFSISNTGTSPLIINSIQTSSQRFRFDTVLVQFPYTIQPQDGDTFRVWFNPNAAASFSDSLVINSNAVNLPVAKLQLTGQGITVNPVLGDILWQGNIPDNPYTSYDDPQPKSSKRIADVNGDGVDDIIVSTGNYYTLCFNGNSSVTADVLWKFNTAGNNNNTGSVTWEDCMQVRTDVNGDGIEDVVAGYGGGNEYVYTLSGRTGQKIWEYGDSIDYSRGDINSIKVDKDFNGDGVNDVLVGISGTGTGNGGRHAVACLNGLNGQEIFYVTMSSQFVNEVVATQFGAAACLSNNGGPYYFNGFTNTGSQVWSNSLTSTLWSAYQIPSIDADTVKEIIGLYGFSGGVFCVSNNNGYNKWNLSLGSSNNGTFILLDDLDSNGSIDFSLSGPQAVHRIDSKTSTTLWTYYPTASYIRDIDSLSDVNGDGVRDIIVGMQQPGNVLVLNGENGNLIFQYSFGSTISARADRVCSINSIDGNSTTEFMGGCRDGRIILFNGGPNNPVGIKPISNVVPNDFVLEQNYPNPFNPATMIKFAIPKLSGVKLSVFDITGKEVRTLVNSELKAGSYEYILNAEGLSSGVYFYRLQTNEFNSVKRMILLK